MGATTRIEPGRGVAPGSRGTRRAPLTPAIDNVFIDAILTRLLRELVSVGRAGFTFDSPAKPGKELFLLPFDQHGGTSDTEGTDNRFMGFQFQKEMAEAIPGARWVAVPEAGAVR